MQIIEANKPIIISTVALINDENEILICKRQKNTTFENYWEFPGGKTNENENPEQTVIRETREEVDITLNKKCLAPLSFSTFYDKKLQLIILLFVSRKWTGLAKPLIPSKIKWIKINKLSTFNMPPANKYLVSSLQDLLM